MSKYDQSSYFFFSFYNKHGVEKNNGILKRRAAEFILYEEGSYYHFDIQKKKGIGVIKQIVDDFYKPSNDDANNNTPNALSPSGSAKP